MIPGLNVASPYQARMTIDHTITPVPLGTREILVTERFYVFVIRKEGQR